eukprot:769535-Pyramimonas_sp.AAC.1
MLFPPRGLPEHPVLRNPPPLHAISQASVVQTPSASQDVALQHAAAGLSGVCQSQEPVLRAQERADICCASAMEIAETGPAGSGGALPPDCSAPAET